MAGLKPVFIGLILTGLFAFALISSGVYLASSNHANRSIIDDQALSSFKTVLESNLSQASTNANSSLESIGNSPISAVLGSTIFDSISGVWKTLKTVPVAVYNLIAGQLKQRIFGDDYGIVLGILSTILMVVIIFGVIKLVTQGQDE